MKRYLLFSLCVIAAQFAFSNLLYDIVDGNFKAEKSPALCWLKDGEHYTIQTDSATIVKYHVKNNSPVDTLFCISKLKDKTLEKISGYEISPDEKLIMVYVNEEKRYRHSFIADYYIYDIEKNRLRPLSEYGKQEAPLFSPNGLYVAFGRGNNLYMRKLDFNTEVAITKDGEIGQISNGIADWLYEEEFTQVRYFDWSPDSKYLAYVKFDEREVSQFSFQKYTDDTVDTDELMLYPKSVSFKYPKAGEQNPKVTVCIYEDYTKNTHYISLGEKEEDYYIPRILWTASPEQLAAFKLNRNQNKLDMYLINAKSTVAKSILSEEDKYYVDYRLIDYVRFHSDTKSFIYASERDGYRHLYRYRINGILDKQLTAGDWDVTDMYGYDEKNNILYYQSAETSPLQRNVYALDAKGKKTLLTDGKGIHKAVFNAAHTYFTDNFSSLENAGGMMIRSNKGVKVVSLQDNKALEEKFQSQTLPKKEFFTFKTSEGIELNGWILKPKNFDNTKKYPLLLTQYSGPDVQNVLDRWDIGWEYFLATNGYVVASVDGRGTGARGAEFRKCTYQQMGILEAKDQIETAKYFGGQSYVDKDRIAIWGWSYGGFMTLSTMSSPEQVFKAGVAVAPVTDWRLYNTAYTERYMRRPQENFRGYEVTSPLLQAENLNGELLIIHGTADDNVHAQNTMLYIDRLVQAGKQFEIQLYTDKDHGLMGQQTRRHLYQRMFNFLQKNL